MTNLEKQELNFYRKLEVETGGLQPYKTTARSLWLQYQNQLAKVIKET